VTPDWLSAAVEKVWERWVGIVVFRGMSGASRPPSTFTPSVRGVTSSRRTSFISPASTAAWMAAPIATTSSGFTLRLGSRPKESFTSFWAIGIRVEPPTRTTSSMSPGLSLASASAALQGSRVDWIRSPISCSSLARVSFRVR
jgi:hypothetical protein